MTNTDNTAELAEAASLGRNAGADWARVAQSARANLLPDHPAQIEVQTGPGWVEFTVQVTVTGESLAVELGLDLDETTGDDLDALAAAFATGAAASWAELDESL